MARRKLEELHLVDDFLFGTLLNHPVYGERFAQILLKIILKRGFEQLKVVPQKVFYGSNTDKHGARLDVYLETYFSENKDREMVIDVEPDQNSEGKYVTHLPRRTRFYHAVIDAECLKSGENYQGLKDVVVIMITTYDPFGLNQILYTIKNKCEEREDLVYDDGAKTVYLYTRGKFGNVSQELKDLLSYMECTTEENACNKELQEIHEMVKEIKMDRGVVLEFMKIFEREQMLIERTREEEQMKYFEREQLLIEKTREEERQRQQKAEQELIERVKRAEAEVRMLKEELQKKVL